MEPSQSIPLQVSNPIQAQNNSTTQDLETLVRKEDKLGSICEQFVDDGWKFTGNPPSMMYLSLAKNMTHEPINAALLKRFSSLTPLKAFCIIFNDEFWDLLKRVVDRNLSGTLGTTSVKATTIGELMCFYGSFQYDKIIA